MITNYEENYPNDKIYEFNKLMIDAVKGNEEEFQFEGKNYMVCSNGVCVQTLINDRVLYRIFVEEDKNNGLINNKVLKYLYN